MFLIRSVADFGKKGKKCINKLQMKPNTHIWPYVGKALEFDCALDNGCISGINADEILQSFRVFIGESDLFYWEQNGQ